MPPSISPVCCRSDAPKRRLERTRRQCRTWSRCPSPSWFAPWSRRRRLLRLIGWTGTVSGRMSRLTGGRCSDAPETDLAASYCDGGVDALTAHHSPCRHPVFLASSPDCTRGSAGCTAVGTALCSLVWPRHLGVWGDTVVAGHLRRTRPASIRPRSRRCLRAMSLGARCGDRR